METKLTYKFRLGKCPGSEPTVWDGDNSARFGSQSQCLNCSEPTVWDGDKCIHLKSPPSLTSFRAHRVGWRHYTRATTTTYIKTSSEPTVWDGDNSARFGSQSQCLNCSEPTVWDGDKCIHLKSPPSLTSFRAHRVGWRHYTRATTTTYIKTSSEPTVWDGDSPE
jgi:Ni,Fe-hydrogenase I small subunit